MIALQGLRHLPSLQLMGALLMVPARLRLYPTLQLVGALLVIPKRPSQLPRPRQMEAPKRQVLGGAVPLQGDSKVVGVIPVDPGMFCTVIWPLAYFMVSLL